MEGDAIRERGTMELEGLALEEEFMVQEDRWKEIHRLHDEEGLPIAAIARRLDIDRKTVRRCLKQEAWRRYQRHASCFKRSEEHTSELQSRLHLVCRLLLEKKKTGTTCSDSRQPALLAG